MGLIIRKHLSNVSCDGIPFSKTRYLRNHSSFSSANAAISCHVSALHIVATIDINIISKRLCFTFHGFLLSSITSKYFMILIATFQFSFDINVLKQLYKISQKIDKFCSTHRFFIFVYSSKFFMRLPCLKSQNHLFLDIIPHKISTPDTHLSLYIIPFLHSDNNVPANTAVFSTPSLLTIYTFSFTKSLK